MANSSTTKKIRQVAGGTLYVGIDLGLEKNWAVVINERAERVDRFSFSSERGGYEYLLVRVEKVRQKEQAMKIQVAMEPTNYFWKLPAQDLEGATCRALLLSCACATSIRQMTESDFLANVQAAYSGKKLPRAAVRRA